jgi:NDP-sugar pyrophosphorylase family protein
MRAMILAAGFGTRLRPLTNHLPKPLLPIGDQPLIRYTLMLLKRYAITEVMINLHHEGEKIQKELGEGESLGMKISYSPEQQILGTGGGIKRVQRWLMGGTFLVINGDILTDINIDKAVEFHHRKKAVATLVLREDPDAEKWGVIGIDEQDRVRQILHRPDRKGEPLTPFMFTGIHLLEPRALDYIPLRWPCSIMEAYHEMICREERIMGYVMKSYWQDIGTPERYEQVRQAFGQGQVRLSHLRNSG